jgi:hypothetical protein
MDNIKYILDFVRENDKPISTILIFLSWIFPDIRIITKKIFYFFVYLIKIIFYIFFYYIWLLYYRVRCIVYDKKIRKEFFKEIGEKNKDCENCEHRELKRTGGDIVHFKCKKNHCEKKNE